MLAVEGWIQSNIDFLFDYALSYVADVKRIPMPKFHMVDDNGRMAIVSCDFWLEEQNRDYAALGAALEKFYKAYKAVAALTVVSGQFNDEEVVGIITYGESTPKLHVKKVIWNHGIVDFGPVVTLPWAEVKNFKF
jgi:hypothetical protein